MKATKLEQGKLYAVAVHNGHPEYGCDRMIFVGDYYGLWFITADDDAYVEEPQEALSAARREMNRMENDHAPHGWKVTERNIACPWDEYEDWKVKREKRSAAAIKAAETKRQKEYEGFKADQAARQAAELASPLGQIEKRIEGYKGVRHAHARTYETIMGSLDDYRPGQAVNVTFNIKMASMAALEAWLAKGEKVGMFVNRPPVIDTEAEETKPSLKVVK